MYSKTIKILIPQLFGANLGRSVKNWGNVFNLEKVDRWTVELCYISSRANDPCSRILRKKAGHDAIMIVLLSLCEGNPAVTSGFLHRGQMMWTFDVFLVTNLNIKSIGQTVELLVFETLRHSSDVDNYIMYESMDAITYPYHDLR